jgi:transcriptional regulator of acetoin/glycerol metabolism
MLLDMPKEIQTEVLRVMNEEKRTLIEAEAIVVIRYINSLKNKEIK